MLYLCFDQFNGLPECQNNFSIYTRNWLNSVNFFNVLRYGLSFGCILTCASVTFKQLTEWKASFQVWWLVSANSATYESRCHCYVQPQLTKWLLASQCSIVLHMTVKWAKPLISGYDICSQFNYIQIWNRATSCAWFFHVAISILLSSNFPDWALT